MQTTPRDKLARSRHGRTATVATIIRLPADFVIQIDARAVVTMENRY